MAQFNVARGRRLGVAATAILAFTGFAAVLTAIESLAVRGQLDFATHVVGLADAWSVAVPVALEGGTLVSAALALWATLRGAPSFMHRVWTGLFLAAAASANYVGALAAGRETVAALYLAAACLAALRMWHAILKMIRLGDLSRSGALDGAVPRFRGLRWLLAPRETFKAWRLAVLERLGSAEDAIAMVRGGTKPATVRTADGGAVNLAEMTKKEAILRAFAELGAFDVPAALAWLSERGVVADKGYAYDLARKESAKRRKELHAVTGGKAA